MIKTPICDLLGIEHPIVLGGMGGGYTQSAMVAAVSNAGGLGTLGCHGRGGDQIGKDAAAIRDATNQPFALNFLLFSTEEDSLAAALEARPAVMSYAWPSGDQDIKPYVRRAHDAGAKVTYMAGSVAEALRGTAAGADIIVAQGTEGGGHVSWMASLVLTPLVVDAVAPIPVLAASPTGAVWRRPWRSAPMACFWAPAFWHPMNRRSTTILNAPLSTATATILA
jgi:NAD(P)H-dependent flavin oxidoreductase YrpB (nitropropane dioxygenase family)